MTINESLYFTPVIAGFKKGKFDYIFLINQNLVV